ncbi:EcsC family protein [Paenibacillus antri]|uniref:EcsC family protein n=1 Tax=Paenibacillus antri TaxID=2582848 RepID=A0A5R9GI23_9BACL|nr:EcsC family protein [Paenibacillus antri]TLS51165.1 EcsC family protein [Paenibacillus antri]
MQATMESEAYLRSELQAIERWESEQKDLWFWEKLGRLPFVMLDKVTPKIVHEKIGIALNEIGSFIQTGGQYLVSEREIVGQVEKEALGKEGVVGFTLDHVRQAPLDAMDRTADALAESRANLATAQGATTGFGGLFTLAIDIPAVLGLSLKVLQEMALCYGYDPQQKHEREFVVKCLQFASSDIVGKKAVLEDLDKMAAARSGQSGEGGERTAMSQLQGWREVVASYRDNFGWKKLFQLVPIAGMVFGAYINRGTLKDVAEAGKMLYRKRRIMERLAASSRQNE